MVINTHDWQIEYLLLPVGLCNTLTIFQAFVIYIFCDLLYVFVVVYVDNILFFSPDLETHGRLYSIF